MTKDKNIPAFTNYEEMAEFWNTHDLADYWVQTEPAEIQCTPQARRRYSRGYSNSNLWHQAKSLYYHFANKFVGNKTVGNKFVAGKKTGQATFFILIYSLDVNKRGR